MRQAGIQANYIFSSKASAESISQNVSPSSEKESAILKKQISEDVQDEEIPKNVVFEEIINLVTLNYSSADFDMGPRDLNIQTLDITPEKKNWEKL